MVLVWEWGLWILWVSNCYISLPLDHQPMGFCLWLQACLLSHVAPWVQRLGKIRATAFIGSSCSNVKTAIEGENCLPFLISLGSSFLVTAVFSSFLGGSFECGVRLGINLHWETSLRTNLHDNLICRITFSFSLAVYRFRNILAFSKMLTL